MTLIPMEIIQVKPDLREIFCHEPTCLCLEPLFDLEPYDLDTCDL